MHTADLKLCRHIGSGSRALSRLTHRGWQPWESATPSSWLTLQRRTKPPWPARCSCWLLSVQACVCPLSSGRSRLAAASRRGQLLIHAACRCPPPPNLAGHHQARAPSSKPCARLQAASFAARAAQAQGATRLLQEDKSAVLRTLSPAQRLTSLHGQAGFCSTATQSLLLHAGCWLRGTSS